VKNYPVRVPGGTAEQFSKCLCQAAGRRPGPLSPASDQVAGDTLLSLAQRYQIRVDDIIALNSISNPRALKVGSNLILPLREGYSRRPLEELADSYARSRRRSYTVRQGDSLWSIARRFEVTEKQLRVWNTLGWSNLLRPGQVLLVSQPAKPAPASTAHRAGHRRGWSTRLSPVTPCGGLAGGSPSTPSRSASGMICTRSHVLQPGQKLTLLVPAGTQG
jgi:membrane-bound lytic murein transglycosylase D